MSPGNGVPPKESAEKSLGEIVGEVTEKASLLVSQEVELAKAEIADKVSKLAKGAAVGAAAGVFLIFAITMFFHHTRWLSTTCSTGTPTSGRASSSTRWR